MATHITKTDLLSIEPLWTKFNEVLIEIQTFSLKKIHLKMSSVKCRPSCLALGVIMIETRNNSLVPMCIVTACAVVVFKSSNMVVVLMLSPRYFGSKWLWWCWLILVSKYTSWVFSHQIAHFVQQLSICCGFVMSNSLIPLSYFMYLCVSFTALFPMCGDLYVRFVVVIVAFYVLHVSSFTALFPLWCECLLLPRQLVYCNKTNHDRFPLNLISCGMFYHVPS